MIHKKIKIIFCGTPDFAVPTLKAISVNSEVELIKVISMPDRPAGRGQKLKSPEVIDFCKENDIPYLQTENINREELPSDVDAIIVLAFAQFLGKKILSLPRLGCFNIHTSLLPKYRGAAPIQYALLHGDQTTGVSIQKMVSKMDAGDICHSIELPIAPSESGGELYQRLKDQAAIEIDHFISLLVHDRLSFHAQDESQVTFAPTLAKSSGFLNFKQSTFITLYNQIRALKPWPGTYCFLNNKRLKVFTIEKSTLNLAPGELSTQFDTMNIGCLNGSIRLLSIQLEGKKITSDTELLNGLKNSNETLFINPENP